VGEKKRIYGETYLTEWGILTRTARLGYGLLRRKGSTGDEGERFKRARGYWKVQENPKKTLRKPKSAEGREQKRKGSAKRPMKSRRAKRGETGRDGAK
jgi:hypothetical protein